MFSANDPPEGAAYIGREEIHMGKMIVLAILSAVFVVLAAADTVSKKKSGKTAEEDKRGK